MEGVNKGYEDLCELLISQVDQSNMKNMTLKTALQNLQYESTQLIKSKERELAKTQKRYERSLGDIRICYEKSSR